MGLVWAFVPMMIPAGVAVQFCWVLFFILKICVVFTWLPALRALPLPSSDTRHLERQAAPQAALPAGCTAGAGRGLQQARRQAVTAPSCAATCLPLPAALLTPLCAAVML